MNCLYHTKRDLTTFLQQATHMPFINFEISFDTRSILPYLYSRRSGTKDGESDNSFAGMLLQQIDGVQLVRVLV
jgi:hypothetical protein